MKLPLLLFLYLLLFSSLKAQQNLEFVENKGQWNKNIQFRGEMNTGAFVLKPDGGYRILQYDTTVLLALYEKIHPHSTKSITTLNFVNTTKTLSTSEPNNIPPSDLDFTISGHVYEVKFLNGNPNPTAIPEKPLETYNNYILGKDSTKWTSNCKVFTAVTYKNIYPNIDVHYYTDKGNLKYDFIIKPGGDASNIVLYIDGASDVGIKKGQLLIKTSVGEVRESIPSCYQFSSLLDATNGRKEVQCNYKLSGNIVRFNIQDVISKDATLIIDPQFIFCSFTGSKIDNWGYSATYDNQGSFYAGGIVFGSGFPVSNGAYQTTFAGGNNGTGEGSPRGFDIGIMKFNSAGTRVIYATYIGGTGNEYPHSLVVDDKHNLIISGKTTSSDYPSKQSHYGSGSPSNGNFDIILTKLNATGTALIGSRVIGGTGNDGVNIGNKYSSPLGPQSIRKNYGDDSRSEVIVDSAGNVYLASCTQSNDFPVTSNAFQQSHAKGFGGFNQDAVVIKTSPDLSNILFSTYLGGNGDDAAFILAFDPLTNNLAVAGGTASTDFPGDTTNVKFPKFQGGTCDGFITLMSNDGSRLIKTSYLGTKGDDIIYGVQYDKWGSPYILGTTTGSWPVEKAKFVQAGAKQFIAKLNRDLSGFVYSTTFGTTNAKSPNISPTAFLVDRCENVYVSGWGGLGNTWQKYQSDGTIGLSITNNAIKRLTDGSDFYFFVLERNANSQLYGSFFGQNGGQYPDHVDGGTSRFDKNGVIYQSVCANCGGGASFPTTSGSAFPRNGTNNNSGCNLAAIKIAFNLSGVATSLRSTIKGVQGKVVGCVPLTVNLQDIYGEGQKYVWSFGDGTPKETTVKPTINHTYNNVGTYTVSLASIDSNTCNIADTSYLKITVANDEAKFNLTPIKTGSCTSQTYLFNNNATAIKPFQNNSFTIDFGDGSTRQLMGANQISHTYPSDGTYKIRLVLTDTNYCNAPDSVQQILRIAQNVKAIIKMDSVGCAPYTAVINNASLAGTQFLWNFGDGTIDSTTDILINHEYTKVGTYTITLIALDNSTCNIKDSTSFVLVTKSKPSAAFSYSPNPPQSNQPILFTNLSTNAVQYEWQFDDGDTLHTTSNNPPVSHTYNESTTYRATLIATNPSGCADTVFHDIKAIVVPDVQVANAIAPNGTNKTIQVRGFGIETMKWVIYNRWGQIVFQTTNSTDSWNGTFNGNGKMLPADVYTYTLDVTFTNKQKYSKTGDITLLR